MKLYTIGFTKKSARDFFNTLQVAEVTKIIDVRLNNVSQLAGFTKRDDLIYFLREICDCGYKHFPEFAPTKEILDGFKKKKISWNEYVRRFNKLIEGRKIENKVRFEELDNACLLCSEPTPDHCHRRLVANYLKKKFNEIEIKHL